MTILKIISTKELNVEKHCKDGFRQILELSFFNKFFIFFWLLGPLSTLLKEILQTFG